jgi:hypothetical protein
MVASARMPVEKTIRSRYFNLCDPRISLPPEDVRNVDVDQVAAGARGRNFVEVLANRIELSESPVCELVTGLPGSGKSTELLRLAARLRDSGWLPVIIDAERTLDIHNTIDVPDVLLAILAETERAVVELEGGDPNKAFEDTTLRKFWSWLTMTEGSLKTVELSAGGEIGAPALGKATVGGKVVLDLKTRPTLRETVRRKLADHVATFVTRIREAIEELDKRAKGARKQGLVVIFDSLEKLQGSTADWGKVLDSAEQIFSKRRAQIELPVHVLYTIPMALVLRMPLPVTLLPMLRVHDKQGRRASGFDAAREIVRRRVPDDVLDLYFGAPEREARVERLIAWSGGYPREIVRLLQSCVAERELTEEIFAGILSLAGDEYRRTVLGSAHPMLARLHVEKPEQLLQDEADRETVDRLLQNGVIMGYLDGELWYDVHPAVQEIPAVAAEVARLEAERAAAGGAGG